MNTAAHYYLAGMGGAADTGVAVGTTVAQTVAPIVLTHTAIGATVAGMLGGAAIAIPVVGAVIAGISIGIEAILHSGCGETCIATSQWANQAEVYLQKNISEYFAVAVPRPRSVQQLAMANFQAIWNRLVQLCSQPGLSTAGKNCIADRQDNACKWKALPPAYPGEPAEGTCWNWWNGYYYPIANDTNVYDDTASTVNAAAASVASSLGINLDPNLLIVLAAAAVVGVLVLS